VPVSRLIELEMKTALNAMAFRGQITAAQLAAKKTLRIGKTDQRKFVPVRLSRDDIATESLRLSETLARTTGCRTVDLLHIATARFAGSKAIDLSDP